MEEYDENQESTLHHDWPTYINLKNSLLKEEIEDQFISTPNLQQDEDTLMQECCNLDATHSYEDEDYLE